MRLLSIASFSFFTCALLTFGSKAEAQEGEETVFVEVEAEAAPEYPQQQQQYPQQQQQYPQQQQQYPQQQQQYPQQQQQYPQQPQQYPQGYQQAPGQPGYAPQPGYAQQDLRPRRLPYQAGMVVPPGYQLRSRVRLGLVISGAAMFGVPYIITASTLSGTSVQRVLAVPVLGPFLAIPDAGDTARPFLVIDGLLQAAGLTMLIIGLTARQQYLQLYASGDRQLTLQPMASRSGGGLGVSMTF